MIKVTAPKDRAVSLPSASGVTVRLQPGETRILPPMFHVVAGEKECSVTPVDTSMELPDSRKETAESREAAIRRATREIAEEGNTAHVTTAGNPRAAEVRRRTGIDDLSAGEIQAVMDADTA